MRLRAFAACLGVVAGLSWGAGIAPAAKPVRATATVKDPPPTPALRSDKATFAIARTVSVPGEGAWEAAVLDDAGKYLYIPRTTHTQVIEAATGKVAADIGPATSARCVVLVPAAHRGFISNGREGTLTVFDLKTFGVLGTVAVGEDPDEMIYDPLSKRVLVCCGKAQQLVPVPADIDLKTGKPDPAVTFEGTPKGIVGDEHGMVYVTLSDKNDVAVIDTRSMKIATLWFLGAWQGPTGISMDRLRSRLFVACGSRINIISATDGHEFGELAVRKTDSWRYPPPTTAFYDGRIFGTCGDGTLAVIGQGPTGKFVVQQTLNTGVGSRPIAVDSTHGKLYLPCMESDHRGLVSGTFKIVVVEKK